MTDEQRSRLLDVRIRRAELSLEEQREKRGRPSSVWRRQFGLAVIGAIGTALLAILNNWWQFQTSTEVERTKLQSSLVLKAIESPDAQERKNFLLFLVDAGLIADPGDRIRNIPIQSVPQATSSAAASTSRTWGIVFGGFSSLVAAQKAIAISPIQPARIVLRRGSYRLVATVDSKPAADQLLLDAHRASPDSYLVNLATWCPVLVDRTTHQECLGDTP